MSEQTPEERLDAARAALATTLDAIEDKLDVPKRVRRAAMRTTAAVRRNPVPWIVGAATAVALAAGAVVYGVVRSRR